MDGDSETEYYAITLVATEDGKIEFGTQTHWAGWVDVEKRQELRKARLVYRRFGDRWESVRQPYRVVEETEEIGAFLAEGGHALVLKEIAESIFGHFLHQDLESVSVWPAGFLAKSAVPKVSFNRSPSPKLRMQVLTRDSRKCRICGRAPETNSDIELHVHHIWPWGQGGLTEFENLITLCHTCHNGLDPHFERSLYDYVRPKAVDPIEAERVRHLQAVARYRQRGGMLGDL